MTTIASLGIQVESGDAVEAKDNLEQLAHAGQKAEKAAEGLATSFDKASSSAGTLASAEGRVAESTEEAMTRLTSMAKASLEASDYHKSLAASLTTTSSAMGSASSAATDWSAYQAEINARARTLMETEERLADSVRQAAAATGVQGDGLQSLLGKINPALAALEKLDQQQADLQKYKNAGLIDAETFREYSARIDASRQKLGDFDEGLKRTRVTSAQTEEALRQLPAQFTDIFTSLAGGQNPLMVLIQQGGQIKDSFGGIENTFDALKATFMSLFSGGAGAADLGSSLIDIASSSKDVAENAGEAGESLSDLAEQSNTAAEAAGNAKTAVDALGPSVGPAMSGFWGVAAAVGAVAAAVGVLVYGYSQGSKEADEYNESLILTGNYAGTTADALASMAERVSAVNGTTGQAAAILAGLAGGGKIASGSFEQIANAAVTMEDATGRAVEATVAEFAELAKDPVKASAKLNEHYNYLTASVYSQIVALEQQGKHQEAVTLATNAYDEAVRSRADSIVENLGAIEAAWKGIKDTAAGVLDGILDVGRTPAVDAQIANLEKIVADRKSGGILSTIFSQDLGPNSRSTKFLEQQLDALKKHKVASEQAAKARGDLAQAELKAQKAMVSVDALTRSSWTNKQKRDDEIEKYRRSLDEIREQSPQDERLNQTIIDQNIANIKKRYKDPQTHSTAVDLTSANDSKNALAAILSDYQNTQKQLDAAQKAGLISQEEYLLKRQALIGNERDEVTAAYESEIAALEEAKGKASTSAAQRIQLDQKIADARANMVKAQKDADSELEVLATNEEGRLRKQALAVQTYTSALDQQVTALRLQGQRSADSLGLGDRQRSLQDQQNGIADRINQQKLDLANQYGDGSRGMSLDEYNQKLAALDKTQRDLQETAIANYNDMTTAQGDWSAGASSAFQNYLESARDVAGQAKTLFTNAFSSMEDAVANFAISGKFSFSDFTKSILADMARIATRQAASGLLSSIAGTALGAWFGGGSGAAPASTTASVGGSTTTFNPQLDTSGLTYQAKGGAWSDGVQFFANGAAFTNSIVSQPTAFSMAGGKTGVMGEAGEEAIMPLARTSGGQLGVRAIGGGGGGGGTYSFPITIQIDASGSTDGGATSGKDAATLGKSIQDAARMEAESAIRKGLAPGGSIYRVIKGR